MKNSGTLNLTVLIITSHVMILRKRMSFNIHENDNGKTKSTANSNVVTNDTHYDKPDTVQNEDDVSAQNGIESIESSLPGQEIDKLAKAKDKIKYRFQDNNEWQKAEVLGRAGKSTGKYKSWFNIKNTSDDGASSID